MSDLPVTYRFNLPGLRVLELKKSYAVGRPPLHVVVIGHRDGTPPNLSLVVDAMTFDNIDIGDLATGHFVFTPAGA